MKCIPHTSGNQDILDGTRTSARAVATMWSINDQDGADVAKLFYGYLSKRTGPPSMGAALALHRAVQEIPFVYLGVTRGMI